MGLAMLIGQAASAQVTNIETPGNLAPTRDPGCIALAQADPMLSPPDLGLGVLGCAKSGAWDRAVDLFILMQLRARFDAQRVVDRTAHQAQRVLALNVSGQFSEDGKARFQEAFTAFGGNGSPRHTAFCATMKQQGPPQHNPSYMIQHGMGAVQGTTDAPLVDGFRPGVVWGDLLTLYLKC